MNTVDVRIGLDGRGLLSQAQAVPPVQFGPPPEAAELVRTLWARMIREHLAPLGEAESLQDFMDKVQSHFIGLLVKCGAMNELLNARPCAAGVASDHSQMERARGIGALLDEQWSQDGVWEDALTSALRGARRVHKTISRVASKGVELEPRGVVEMLAWVQCVFAATLMAGGLASGAISTTSAARKAILYCLNRGPVEAYAAIRAMELAQAEEEESDSGEDLYPPEESPLMSEMEALDRATDKATGV